MTKVELAMRYMVFLCMFCVSGPCFGEKICFRSANEAAAQSGVRAADGFWLETLRRDVFSGVTWGSVRSCARPERPAVLLKVAASTQDNVTAPAAFSAHLSSTPLPPSPSTDRVADGVAAGSLVRVVRIEPSVRLEFAGIALASGAVGERIRVRVAAGAGNEDKVLVALVRGSGLLEMEER